MRKTQGRGGLFRREPRAGVSLLRHARHRRQSGHADGRAEIKVAATRDYSAEVVLHGENFNDTIAKVSEIVEMEGRIFIPPYDDPKVIAGEGTIGPKSSKIYMTWIT